MEFIQSLLFEAALFLCAVSLLLHLYCMAKPPVEERDVILIVASLILFGALVVRLFDNPPVNWVMVVASWSMATYLATDPRIRELLPEWLNHGERNLNSWLIGKLGKIRNVFSKHHR